MVADRRRRRAARQPDGSLVAEPLWRRLAGDRRPPAGRRCDRQRGLHRGAARGRPARWPLSADLRRRPGPRAGRPLVGAGRPHPGALRRGLCPGEPAGAEPRLSEPLQRHERRATGAILRRVPQGPGRGRRPRRPAHLPSDPRPVQPDLFRTGAPGALPGLPAGRGRRPDRPRRPRLCADHRRAEAGRRDPAARRRQFHRSPGAEQRLAPGHARPAGRHSLRRRGDAQHARLRRRGVQGPAGLPAKALPPAAGRRAEDAQRRHLVVRPAPGAGERRAEFRRSGDLAGVQRAGRRRGAYPAPADGRPVATGSRRGPRASQ